MGQGTSDNVCCVGDRSQQDKPDIPDLNLLDGLVLSNHALLIIEPRVASEAVRNLAMSKLRQQGVTVRMSGEIPAHLVVSRSLVDKHFGATAARAVRAFDDSNSGGDLPRLVPLEDGLEAFRRSFGEPWAQAVADRRVLSAVEAAERLGITAAEMARSWEEARGASAVVRLDCHTSVTRMGETYVVNGFYLERRARFHPDGGSVFWISAEFHPRRFSWSSFSTDVVGSPHLAPEHTVVGSLRHTLHAEWKRLGLPEEPKATVGIHSSQSPFQATVESMNWLGTELHEDHFGKVLLSNGVPKDAILAWLQDPTVQHDGLEVPVFSCFRGLNAKECLDRAREIVDECRRDAL